MHVVLGGNNSVTRVIIVCLQSNVFFFYIKVEVTWPSSALFVLLWFSQVRPKREIDHVMAKRRKSFRLRKQDMSHSAKSFSTAEDDFLKHGISSSKSH